MERGEFYRHIRDEIAEDMDKKEVSVERAREVAQKALELGNEHAADIPDTAIEKLRSEFPDVLGSQEPQAPEEPPSGGETPAGGNN